MTGPKERRRWVPVTQGMSISVDLGRATLEHSQHRYSAKASVLNRAAVEDGVFFGKVIQLAKQRHAAQVQGGSI